MLKTRDRVERADGSGVGSKDRYGTVLGYDGANGDTYRQGWRVRWDFGGVAIYQEHELNVVDQAVINELERRELRLWNEGVRE